MDGNKLGKNKEKLERLLSLEKEKRVTNDMNRNKFERRNTITQSPIHNHTELNMNNPSNTRSSGESILQNTFNFMSPLTDVGNKFINTSKKRIFYWLGIPTKYDEMVYYAKWWKVYDNCITIINIMIIVLAFYDYELNFNYPRNIMADYNSVRLIMITLALLTIFCVTRRHYMKNKWKNIKIIQKIYIDDAYGGGKSGIQDFFFQEDSLIIGDKKIDSILGMGLLRDVIINLIIPYPHMDFHIYFEELDRENNILVKVDYLLSDFIYVFLLFRTLYVVRAFVNYSIFSDHYALKISKENKVQNNFRFAIKCLIKVYHIKLVMWFFFGSVLIFGFMLRIFERPYWVQMGRIEFNSFQVPMWCTFITMLTIGYGDFSPLTKLGKIICVLSGLWGVFISSMIIVCLHGLLDLSNDQFNVFTKVVKSRVAVNFIETAYLFHKSKYFLDKKNINESKVKYRNMIELYVEFKNMRNESKSIYRSNGLLHYNMKLLKEMNKINHRMNKIEIDLDAAKKKV